MIRSELLQALAQENPELRADDIERIVEVFFDEIAQQLAGGGRVELRGFGAFSSRERDARKGRNPRTGEAISIPASRSPKFRGCGALRAAVSALATTQQAAGSARDDNCNTIQ